MSPGGSATLTLSSPASDANIGILESAQGGGNNWNVTFNFSDATTYNSGNIFGPDWTSNATANLAGKFAGLAHRASTWSA
jgi:hypothetical protein